MSFTEFQEKNCLKSSFPDRTVLSSEHLIPEQDESGVSESLVKSGETEFYQAFLPDSVLILQLEEFFEAAGGLTDQGLHPVSPHSVLHAFAEAAEVFSDGDESLRSGAGATATVALLPGHVVTASHERMDDIVGRVSTEVRQAAESEVCNDCSRASAHPFYIKVKGFRIKSFVIRTADEVFNGYHKAVPAECQLQSSPELAVRMTLSLFYRSGVRVVEGDDAVLYMPLPGNLQQGLLFENVQEAEHYDGFLFPLRRSLQRPDLFLKSFQGGNEHSVENGQPCGPVPFFFQAELPPEPLQLLIIPPDGNAVRFRKGPHFIECLENQPDIIRINDVAFQDGRINQGIIPRYDSGPAKHFENIILNDSDPLRTKAFSENAKGGGMKESLQSFVRNIAEILNIPVFFHLFHNFPVALPAEPGNYQEGDHNPEGSALSPRNFVIKRGQPGDNPFPRNDPSQNDEPVSGICNISFNPFGGKGIFKCILNHFIISLSVFFRIAVFSKIRSEALRASQTEYRGITYNSTGGKGKREIQQILINKR